jgi:hypothetical protein
MAGQSPKAKDIAPVSDDILQSVTPADITGTAIADISGVETDQAAAEQPTADTQTGYDIPLTVIEDKPDPPAPPAGAQQGGENATHEKPADTALTDPDVKPDATPVPAQPAMPPQDTSTQSESHSGEIYIPGFGWVVDEGGGGQGEVSVGEGSMDKIIGY